MASYLEMLGWPDERLVDEKKRSWDDLHAACLSVTENGRKLRDIESIIWERQQKFKGRRRVKKPDQTDQ